MLVNGQPTRTIQPNPENDRQILVIDQRWLPHRFVHETVETVEQMALAIREMHVRGAPLIGVSAAYGLYLSAREHENESFPVFMSKLKADAKRLNETRPTAINLAWALEQQFQAIEGQTHVADIVKILFDHAGRLAEEDVKTCRSIGEFGLEIIKEIAARKNGQPVNILTHCNAGWLGCVDYGTATAPMYLAFDAGIPVHVWVDETRPRNQGASLTAWELGQHGVPHTVIADNTGGHLMQHGLVDFCIVGTDRTTRMGDVCNKIGTYLKALAAADNGLPFYVALPSSTIDWKIADGVKEIPIEERSEDEVRFAQGLDENGEIQSVLLPPAGSRALNYGFDVTPARLVTQLITERGRCAATEEGILSLFPERK